MNKEVIIKSLLEFGRIILIAVIPVAISSIEKGEIDFKSIAVVAVIAGLKAVDKLLHEYNKELPKADQNSGLLGEKGLTGF